MKPIAYFNLILALSIFIFASNCAGAQQKIPVETASVPSRIVLRAARLLDVAQGRIIKQPVILIEGDKIIAVQSNLDISKEINVIDLGDVTLLPGLIDAHTHITYHFDKTGHFGLVGDTDADEAQAYAAENARLTIDAGFTTVRNLAAGGLIDIALRDSINQGKIPGPRMLVSGEPLTANYLSGITKSEDRINLIRKFIDQRIAEHVDVIKIFEGVDERGAALFSSREIRAAAQEAAKQNLKIAVHAHEAEAIKAALKGGCDSIEHGTFLDDEAIKLLVKGHVALVPTLYLPTYYLEHKDKFAFDSSTWEFFENLKSKNLSNFKRAKAAGVWIVSGSDAVAGLDGQNAKEIIWLVKAGMKPEEAIRAATIDSAELLGLGDQTGEIKTGKLADIIAVVGNPLNDISDLERTVFVMKEGKIFKNEKNK